MDNVRKLIQERAKQLGLSLAELSIKLGKNHAYLQQFINRGVPRRLDEHARAELAGLLTVPEQNLLPEGEILPVRPVRSVETLASIPQIVPGDMLVGARDFPIYAATQGGNGHAIIHSDVMEWVKRPVILEGVPDSYGIYVLGDSMIPAYRPGDMALVHPRRPLERDTDIVLYDNDHRTGEAKSMIKRLLSFNDRQLKLEQYNPANVFSEHRADWPICHQVVGMYKGRR